jgi:hypothetical protein
MRKLLGKLGGNCRTTPPRRHAFTALFFNFLPCATRLQFRATGHHILLPQSLGRRTDNHGHHQGIELRPRLCWLLV